MKNKLVTSPRSGYAPGKVKGPMKTEAVGTTRTYEPVKIKFRGPCQEVIQTDHWTGQTVPQDKATETHIVLDVEMKLRGLTQGFEVLGKIREKGFNVDKLEAKVKAALVAGVPKRLVLDFFRTTEVTVTAKDPELDAWEADSQLDDLHAPHLEEQAKAGNAAADAWKAEIEDVIDGLRDGYDFNRDKVRDGIMFLEWCHRSANNGMMHMWCQEKLGYIRSDMAKLAKYKSCTYPNAIKVAENIQGLLRSWPVVNSWHEQPPRRPTRN